MTRLRASHRDGGSILRSRARVESYSRRFDCSGGFGGRRGGRGDPFLLLGWRFLRCSRSSSGVGGWRRWSRRRLRAGSGEKPVRQVFHPTEKPFPKNGLAGLSLRDRKRHCCVILSNVVDLEEDDTDVLNKTSKGFSAYALKPLGEGGRWPGWLIV
jgi:hypothetical protein